MKDLEKLKEQFKDNKQMLAVLRKTEEYLKVADDITCEYCGLRSGDFPNIEFHKDHIVPRYFGGTNELENLADACMPCNLRKKDQRGWKTLSGRKGKSNYMINENNGWSMPMPADLRIDPITQGVDL